jgi:hypothetical protein
VGYGVTLELSVEVVAKCAAELVLERLDARDDAAGWPAWMSVETAARHLDSPVERLRKLKDRHAIPYSQEGPGCRVFFRRADLDAWMERQQPR